MDKHMMNYREAATYLGLSVNTLQAWVSRGWMPFAVKLGRAVRFKVSDLDEFVESRKSGILKKNAGLTVGRNQ